jgi:hypothetical protein
MCCYNQKSHVHLNVSTYYDLLYELLQVLVIEK